MHRHASIQYGDVQRTNSCSICSRLEATVAPPHYVVQSFDAKFAPDAIVAAEVAAAAAASFKPEHKAR